MTPFIIAGAACLGGAAVMLFTNPPARRLERQSLAGP
jgi:hypothetical protein